MCQKLFSRRDAFKRHAATSKEPGPTGLLCTDADVIEVELEEGDSRTSWIGASAAAARQGLNRDQSAIEEGEVLEQTITAIQSEVLALHHVLQGLVGNVLNGHAQARPPELHAADAPGGQATLASVIARAQNLPPSAPPPDTSAMQGVVPASSATAVLEAPAPSHDVEMAPPTSGADPAATQNSASPTDRKSVV